MEFVADTDSDANEDGSSMVDNESEGELQEE